MLIVVAALGLLACDKVRDPLDSGAAIAAGRCEYVNPFSEGAECKEYLGSYWNAERGAQDCGAPLMGADEGEFMSGVGCEYPSVLGRCIIDEGFNTETHLVFPGDDSDACGGVEMGCGFGRGEFLPSGICQGV